LAASLIKKLEPWPAEIMTGQFDSALRGSPIPEDCRTIDPAISLRSRRLKRLCQCHHAKLPALRISNAAHTAKNQLRWASAQTEARYTDAAVPSTLPHAMRCIAESSGNNTVQQR